MTLKRTDGQWTNINLYEMEVYDENGIKYTEGITATAWPAHPDPYADAKYLIDGRLPCRDDIHRVGGNTYATPHTSSGQGGYMQLDLGANKPVHRVVVYNRAAACNHRIIGTTLVVTDGSTEVYSQEIQIAYDVHSFGITCGTYSGIPDAGSVVIQPCCNGCMPSLSPSPSPALVSSSCPRTSLLRRCKAEHMAFWWERCTAWSCNKHHFVPLAASGMMQRKRSACNAGVWAWGYQLEVGGVEGGSAYDSHPSPPALLAIHETAGTWHYVLEPGLARLLAACMPA